jgi:alpha-beta hydrolase superfamily lysophospholipase
MTLTLDTPQTASAEEGTFPTADGAALFYRHWNPTTPSQNAIVLFHRGHEHSGRYQHLVEVFADCHVFAWDARGHGRSPGERGYAESFSNVIEDMDRFVRFVADRHQLPMENMIVLGHSVGAVAVAAWVHDYAPPIRGMVLVTPALRVKLYVPFALAFLRLRNRFGKSFIKSYVRAGMLTHDGEQAAAYAADPLISRNIATNILLDLHDTATRLLDDAGAIRTPVLVLGAGADWVVKNSAQKKFFDRLGSSVKEMVTYDGFYHAILHEKNRSEPIAKIRQFVEAAFAAPDVHPGLVEGDPYTAMEFERLSKPLPITSFKRWNFIAQTISMKTLLRLSDGVRLGWKTGFDSGESLDYVYKNKSRGVTPLGKFIDRQYLNAIGWAGIRVRKVHLQQLLKSAIDQTRQQNKPVRILDIAGGGARYLLDVLQELPDASALVRDRSATALATGKQTAEEMGLKNITFAEGDAFSAESLAAIEPKPTIGIVSGLYELFGNNKLILASLGGLARVIPIGGYLIYTNQPWHPQIEMIARVLTNRDGKPWIMRRRTQAEMDQLVQSAGFEKMEMKIDKFGIFTVSLARRVRR